MVRLVYYLHNFFISAMQILVFIFTLTHAPKGEGKHCKETCVLVSFGLIIYVVPVDMAI